MMRHQSAEEQHITALLEDLRTKITIHGRWHLKRRKSDATRIWKMLFRDLENLVEEERHPFTNSAYIAITVYPKRNQYSIHVHKHNRSCYHGYVARRDWDYKRVITEINSVLKHYNLTLIETADSLKRSNTFRINPNVEYEVKFVETN